MATRQRRETSPTPDPAGEASIDAYHRGFPPAIRARLEEIRVAIREAAPQATETISYGMPAFRQHRVLVYYAAHARHIGFYPTPSAIKAFSAQLKGYVFSKGAVQFPVEDAMPLVLIQKMVKYRVAEENERAKVAGRS